MATRLMFGTIRHARLSCSLTSNGIHRSQPWTASTFYSKGLRTVPAQCSRHSSSKVCPVSTSRNKSSTATAAAVEEVVENHHGTVKPFEDIPTPGGYDKGLRGTFAPMYHAWKHGAFNKPHEYQNYTAKELGPIYRLRTNDGWMVVLSEPADIEKTFRHVGKYPKRPTIQPWIDHRHDAKQSLGLLTSDGEEWHKLRSALSKGILRPNVVGRHVGNMHSIALELIEKVKSIRRPDGVIPDIEIELYKWAMESSATFVFDRRLNLITEKVLKPENQAFFDALRVLTFKSFEILMVPDFILKLLPAKRNPTNLTNDAWDEVFSLAKSYLDEKMGQLAKKAVRAEDLDDGTFVAFLMIQDQLTPAEIYGNVSEILAASVDTTSFTSTWGIHLLSKYPGVQEKLLEEVERVIPVGKTPVREQIDNMPYLKAVVKEVQRLYPITMATARILEDDIVLRGHHIPKGTQIQTNFYSACRRPNIFDDPEEFRPDRWLNPDKKYHPFASMPFGHGTRMCVGRRLAQQEMYLLLAEMVRNFKIEPTKPDVQSTCGIIINPETSIEPRLIDRR